jgi:predicted transcriptional regulator
MVVYRTKIEIIGDILVSAQDQTVEHDGASIMQLIRHVNIPHGRLSKILSNLVSQGLLEQVNSDRAYKYRISGTGKNFLNEYKKFYKFTSDFGLSI